MKRLVVSSVMAVAVGLCFVPSAFADSMVFGGTVLEQGTGFGNILNLLTLQQNDAETGAVVPTSNATGDAGQTSNTWTASQLMAEGITADNFGIIFNPNETGGAADSVYVESFFLDFYHAGETVAYATASLIQVPITIVPISPGQGSQGWEIIYTNTGDLTAFFNSPDGTDILGAHGSISDTSDGPDDFSIFNTGGTRPPDSVPEPSTMLILGFGLIGMVGARRKLKK